MRAAGGHLGDVLPGSRKRPREAEGAGKLENVKVLENLIACMLDCST